MARLHFLKLLFLSLFVMALSVTASGALADAQGQPSGTDADEWSAEGALLSGEEEPESRAANPEEPENADGGEMSNDSGETVSNPARAARFDPGETTAPREIAANPEQSADLESGEASGDSGETTAPREIAANPEQSADLESDEASDDSGETTAPSEIAVNPEQSADLESGETVANPGQPEDSGQTPASDEASDDSGETVANPAKAARSDSGRTMDPGETTASPPKTSNSGKASASAGSPDSGDTTASRQSAVDSDESLYGPERAPNYGNPRTPDNGETTVSRQPAVDSDESLYGPERAPDYSSPQTSDSGKTSDSGATVRDSGKTSDSGKTADRGKTLIDPGETTAAPVKRTDSGNAPNSDNGETTDSGRTENPENQVPINTPPKPVTPQNSENPENQVPVDTSSAPSIPVNTDYGTLPNKRVSQWTISDVYTPGRKTGQYFTYQGSRIPIYAGVKTRNVYSGEFVWRSGHRLRYVGNRYNAQFGVDVSAYQNRDRSNQTINWAAAKADGVQFAMIRVGLRGTSTGSLREDTFYARNIDGAMAQGIQTGVYIFAQAKTIAEAVEEADFVIARLRGHKINGPVSYDWEMKDSSYRVYGTSPEMATACAVAFCKRVAAAGYTPMVYNSRYVAYVKYDQGALAPYMMWYPQYSPTSTTYPYPNLYYQMDYWQFTDSAVVEGIGRKIDANIWFKPKS